MRPDSANLAGTIPISLSDDMSLASEDSTPARAADALLILLVPNPMLHVHNALVDVNLLGARNEYIRRAHHFLHVAPNAVDIHSTVQVVLAESFRLCVSVQKRSYT